MFIEKCLSVATKELISLLLFFANVCFNFRALLYFIFAPFVANAFFLALCVSFSIAPRKCHLLCLILLSIVFLLLTSIIALL